MIPSRVAQTYSSCPVCGGSKLKDLWDVSGYTIARCATCTLVFVRNQVTSEELAAHYASGTDGVYDESNVECLNYYYNKIANLIRRRYPTPGRVLDLGCSRGWFLDTMTGWECHGSEIVTADAEAAQARYGDRIVTGSFEQYPLREAFFDVITLMDVFDHVRDPVETLDKCYRMLKPGGLILLKVHNISCLYSRLTGKSFYAIIPPSHLFYYDARSLAFTLARGGFQVTDSMFIGHLLKLKTVFARLSRGNPKSLSAWIYRKLEGSRLGEIRFHKNLRDIITVLAVKPS